MKKFTVIWFKGCIDKPEEIIDLKIMEANNINEVKCIDILDTFTKKNYEVNIRYCLRTILFADNLHILDYGSHAEFIAVIEGEFDNKSVIDAINSIINQKN